MYKNNTKHLLPLLAACLLWAGCMGGQAPADPSDGEHLVVLYTTDVHGAVLPFDFTQNKPLSTSLAHACSYIKEVREENPGSVILLDGGDLTQGNPAMYYYNYMAMRKPHMATRAANYLAYDAVVIGNHDFEAGEDTYLERLPRQFDMHLLAANVYDTRTDEPAFKPYVMLERQGYRIAVVGFVTPAIYQWLPKSVWPHLSFRDMLVTAEELVPRLLEEEKPDLVIGVFHAGSELYTLNEFHQPRTRMDGVIPTLMQVPGFDLALMGHDHESMATRIVNNFGDTIPILEPGDHAEQIGRADIFLSRDASGRLHKRIAMSRVEVEGYPADPAFCQAFKDEYDAVNDFLDKPIGQLAETLDGAATLVGPSNLLDFIHDVQFEVTGADISFASALSSFEDIEAGDLTMRQIFAMYRYVNHVHKLWMTGADVKRFLEYGYARQFNRMLRPEDHLLGFRIGADGNIPVGRFGPELRTPQYNFTSARGIVYTVDVSQPAGQRVTIHSMANGQSFGMTHTYQVAINSYQASGGGGFLTEGLGWTIDDIAYHTITESSKDMYLYIADYIRERGVVTPPSASCWHVEPAEWWSEAARRDRDYLMPYLVGGHIMPHSL